MDGWMDGAIMRQQQGNDSHNVVLSCTLGPSLLKDGPFIWALQNIRTHSFLNSYEYPTICAVNQFSPLNLPFFCTQ